MDTGHFDGACEPKNPGGAMGWGWTIDFDDGTSAEGEGYAPAAPSSTNNIAEYRALLDLLTAYITAGREGPMTIYGDSQLVVRQVNGEWACNVEHLRALRDEVRALLQQVPLGVTLQHVPREKNVQADALSVMALTEHGIQRIQRSTWKR